MLNDFFITKDAPGFLLNYLNHKKVELPGFRHKLETSSSKAPLSYEQWWSMLDELNQALSIPALGVDIGRHMTVEQCGLLGYLFRTSANVLEALSCYQRFERLLYAGSHVQASIENQELVLAWPPENGLSSQHSDALLLASLVSIIREVLNQPGVHPVRVHFTHGIPAEDVEYYNAFFQCPIAYAQRGLEIRFKVGDLSQKIPFHDSVLHSILDQQAAALVKTLPESDPFVVSVRNILAQKLPEGCASASVLARELNMSSRSLHRKLQARGELFRDALKDVRIAMARHYLADPKLSIAEITLLLGYSEQSAFNRAHQGWFGQSPLKHRKQLLGNSA